MIAQDLQSLQGGGDSNKDIKKRSLDATAKTTISSSKNQPASLPKIIIIGAIVTAVAAIGIMALHRRRR
jgi:hypothetical protein